MTSAVSGFVRSTLSYPGNLNLLQNLVTPLKNRHFMILGCGAVLAYIAFRIFKAWQYSQSDKTISDSMPNKIKDKFNKIKDLANMGKIREAWNLYVRTSDKETGHHGSYKDEGLEALRGWHHLPPEELIFGMIGKTGPVDLSIISIECVRNCVIAYPDFRQSCIQQDNLWECFNAYPEYIADISKQHPDFAFQVVTSRRAATIQSDDFRFEIFNAAYPKIIESIQNNKMTYESLQNLGTYLLHCRWVISKDDYEKVKKIGAQIQENSAMDPKCAQVMNFVVGKLSLQGIYESGKNLLQSVTFEGLSSVFSLSHSWVDDAGLSQMMMDLEMDEDIQNAMKYLDLLSRHAPNYISAKMVLGQIWMDHAQHLEAGRCFLQAAEAPGCTAIQERDALLLAATCLVVKDSAGEYISREKAKQKNIPMQSLSPEECQRAEKVKLLDILRKSLTNY